MDETTSGIRMVEPRALFTRLIRPSGCAPRFSSLLSLSTGLFEPSRINVTMLVKVSVSKTNDSWTSNLLRKPEKVWKGFQLLLNFTDFFEWSSFDSILLQRLQELGVKVNHWHYEYFHFSKFHNIKNNFIFNF